MPFKYVGHLEYQNAFIKYRTLAGVTYEIPGSYSGAYPGSTRESQTVETDSVVISIPGAATAQQWTFQAPASSHPAFEDMFDAQEDNQPRQFQVELAERILYEQDSPGIPAVANLAIVSGVGTILGNDAPVAEQYPVNSVIYAGDASGHATRLLVRTSPIPQQQILTSRLFSHSTLGHGGDH